MVDFTLNYTNGVNVHDAVVFTDQSGNYVDMINVPAKDASQVSL